MAEMNQQQTCFGGNDESERKTEKVGGESGDSRQLKPSFNRLLKSRCFVSFVIIFCLLFSFGCVGPWPSISVDAQGLGQGQIADYLRLPAWDHDEKRIADKVKFMLATANKSNPSRISAESIGMTCASPPSKMCQYTGVVKYQAHGTPKENIDAGKPTVISVEITLPNYDEPRNVVVKKAKTIIR